MIFDNFPKLNLHLGGFPDHVTSCDDSGENRRGLLLRLSTATACLANSDGMATAPGYRASFLQSFRTSCRWFLATGHGANSGNCCLNELDESENDQCWSVHCPTGLNISLVHFKFVSSAALILVDTLFSCLSPWFYISFPGNWAYHMFKLPGLS